MSGVFTEMIIIAVLIIINGVFAMAEIAIVSSRRTKLREMAKKGDKRADTALQLSESPNSFLSTIQVGITLIGILAGAFGGATIAKHLSSALQKLTQ